MRIKNLFFVLSVMTLTVASAVHAQEDRPYAGYVYPAGGQRGTTFTVLIGGEFLEGATIAHVSGDGVQMDAIDYMRPLNQGAFKELQNEWGELLRRKLAGETLTEEEEARLAELEILINTFFLRQQSIPSLAETVVLSVTIAPDAKLGERELRLQTDLGLTNPLIFNVGELPEFSEVAWRNDFEEIDEIEDAWYNVPSDPGATPPPRDPEVPTDITLPATVNGQILPGDWDFYRFSAYGGQKLVIDVNAQRMIPFISDAVPGWFQATVTLFDTDGKELAYNDDFRFHPDPLLLFEIPKDGEYIIKIKDALYRGRESFVYRLAIGELPVLTDIFPLGGRSGGNTAVHLNGWNLPQTDLSITAGEAGSYIISELNGQVTYRPAVFSVDTLPECFENEPNNEIGTVQSVNFPIIVNGQVNEPDDLDVFRFHGKAGDRIVAEVYARRLGSPMDSKLKLTDEFGTQLAFNDDYEESLGGMIFFRHEGLITHHSDSRIAVTLPKDGQYYLHLGDAQAKGGDEYAYRLHLEAYEPDFELFITPSSINARAGTTVPITVHALRKNDFAGDITIDLIDPPAGFILKGGLIPAGKDVINATLTFPAEPSGAVHNLFLEGRATIEQREVFHELNPSDNVMQAFLNRHLVPAQELKACLYGSPQDFTADLLFTKTVQIPAGGSVRVPVDVDQKTSFGSVILELNDPPDGITIESFSLRAGTSEIVFHGDAKLVPGMKGNLIVNAYAEKTDDGDSDGKDQKTPDRVLVTALPAIPFEVVSFTVIEDSPESRYVENALVHSILPGGRHNVPVIMVPGQNLSSYIFVTTPDGREGWAQMFAAAGYDVHVINDPNFDFLTGGFNVFSFFVPTEGAPPKDMSSTLPWQEDVWRRWGFGSSEGVPYPDTRFPTDFFADFAVNYPFVSSAGRSYSDAIVALLEEVGPSILLGHSAGGAAVVEAAKKRPDLVRGFIMIEPTNPPDQEDFPTLAGMSMYGIYGDYIGSRNQSSRKAGLEAAAELFNQNGGIGEVVSLPNDLAVAGNTHLMMQDNNNDMIANRIIRWVTEKISPIGESPTADFSYQSDSLHVVFTDKSTDADGSPVTWNWDFGDGHSSAVQNPSHSYGSNGSYNVTLAVMDNDGNSDTVSRFIEVSGTAMYVKDISMSVASRRGTYAASASVSIIDRDGAPVTNSEVHVEWSGAFESTDSVMTDAGGIASFSSARTSSPGPFTVTVTNVTHEIFTYKPELNTVTTASISYTK